MSSEGSSTRVSPSVSGRLITEPSIKTKRRPITERMDMQDIPFYDIAHSWSALATKNNYSQWPREFMCSRMPMILQKGPNCGLVALSMVSLISCHPKTVDELFAAAVRSGFTLRGEMFSAKNLYTLCVETLQDDFDIELHSDGLKNCKEEFFNSLRKGAVCLVPYDADRDNTPANFNGHRAHWAVICGFIIDGPNHFVLAAQGKSKFVGIWPFESLQESNECLVEISPERLSENAYKIYDIRETLANHYITLKLKE